MPENTLRLSLSGAIARVTLCRPEARNALDATLTGHVTHAFQKLSVADAVRVVILDAEGEAFSAGADLQTARDQSVEDNRRDAMEIAVMLDAVERCAKPVLALVHGAAFGAGAALAACADIALAAESASFALTGVHLGLDPAPILPYLDTAIGLRACRRYLLTGERFDAREAWRLGLVHGVTATAQLTEAADRMISRLLDGAPKAQAAIKESIRVLPDIPFGPDRMRWCAERLASSRAGDEAKEGAAAFFEKRRPRWTEGT